MKCNRNCDTSFVVIYLKNLNRCGRPSGNFEVDVCWYSMTSSDFYIEKIHCVNFVAVNPVSLFQIRSISNRQPTLIDHIFFVWELDSRRSNFFPLFFNTNKISRLWTILRGIKFESFVYMLNESINMKILNNCVTDFKHRAHSIISNRVFSLDGSNLTNCWTDF